MPVSALPGTILQATPAIMSPLATKALITASMTTPATIVLLIALPAPATPFAQLALLDISSTPNKTFVTPWLFVLALPITAQATTLVKPAPTVAQPAAQAPTALPAILVIGSMLVLKLAIKSPSAKAPLITMDRITPVIIVLVTVLPVLSMASLQFPALPVILVLGSIQPQHYAMLSQAAIAPAITTIPTTPAMPALPIALPVPMPMELSPVLPAIRLPGSTQPLDPAMPFPAVKVPITTM